MNTTETPTAEFAPWPKIARLNREIVVTEKIDGTNAQVAILPVTREQSADLWRWVSTESPTGYFGLFAGSRTRWVTPSSDNYSFAAWVLEHFEELATLGPGRHFGEWWGRGINRNYGIQDRRFSLFNTTRWCPSDEVPLPIPNGNPKAAPKYQQRLPKCCGLVPVLYRGPFLTYAVSASMDRLKRQGSVAAPGFVNPEGVVVYHTAANTFFKVTLENDEAPKSSVQEQEYKCVVCGKVWKKSETHSHHTFAILRTCGNLACGANCRPVKTAS